VLGIAVMSHSVTLFNRLLWRPLYAYAERRFGSADQEKGPMLDQTLPQPVQTCSISAGVCRSFQEGQRRAATCWCSTTST
jgi:hypothetical protein